MKFFNLLFLLLPFFSLSQGLNNDSNNQVLKKRLDSLHNQLTAASTDSARYRLLDQIYFYYQEKNRDSALYYLNQQLELAINNNKKLDEAFCLASMGFQLMKTGRLAESFKNFQRAFKIAEDPGSEKYHWKLSDTITSHTSRLNFLVRTHRTYGHLMGRVNNVNQQIFHYKESLRIGLQTNNRTNLSITNLSLGSTYFMLNNLDSALYCETIAEKISRERRMTYFLGDILVLKGDIFLKKGLKQQALDSYYEGVQHASVTGNFSTLTGLNFRLAAFYILEKQKDSSLYYAQKTKTELGNLGGMLGVEYNTGTAYENIYEAFKLNNEPDSTFKYLTLAKSANDSLNKEYIQQLSEFQDLFFQEQLRLEELEKDKMVYQNRVRTYFMLAGISVLLLLAIIFYRNIRQKHRAKIKIEQAYANLKATQQQLIQSEKMASLGELTAGIAHEIQNPLNFVNNFSDVNTELIGELKSELATGNMQLAKEIADDIKENEEKINHHGKRADAIVKGMLQHSRTSSGQKEPTDINALADEYLRLAYHGLRAKDKSFNAKFETNFDNSVGKINVAPQDIGRVIFNLINNAFYTVNEKQKQSVNGYEPTVAITTAKYNGKVEIKVSDNGNGIPQRILEKIFQPFFTTKPTGQGTGLGLSLAYDIITKGHGGELKVETKEGEGSEFIILLPINGG
ncbi:MAG TPA: ATP-binding protein [Chitinophagaceae bacterium]